MEGNAAPARFSRERWGSALNAILHGTEVDPFLDWLENLPKWDRTDRLSIWLGVAFAAADDSLVRWASRYVFLGAVERAYRPGAKLDVMPVLVGPQGAGKSSVLSLMFPEDRAEWFTDSLSLAADAKTRAEALQGRVLVEISEMTGSTRAEIQALKAFLSRQDDGGARLSYRRNPEPMPRRCILVGTSNEAECLPNDPTGNRRFLVIEIEPHVRGAAGARGVMLAWRDQLWAEALQLHRGGAQARLPDDLATAQAALNERHRAGDTILEDALDDWLAGALAAREPFKLEAALRGCGVDGAKPWAVRRYLSSLGYSMRQTSVDGVKARWWSRW